MPIQAQTESPTPVAQTELSATTQPSAKIVPIIRSPIVEPTPKAEPSDNTEPSAKIEPSGKIESRVKTAPSAQFLPSVEAFVAKLDNATRAIHENSKKDPTLVQQGCRDLLNKILDLDTMARASNVDIWEKMTSTQRDTFRMAFERRMIGNCVQQLGGYKGESLQLAGVRGTDDGHLLATVRIGSQEDGKLVTWRLHGSSSDGLRADDVVTEGRSAVLDARNEFAAVLQSVNGDIEALIAIMQK